MYPTRTLNDGNFGGLAAPPADRPHAQHLRPSLPLNDLASHGPPPRGTSDYRLHPSQQVTVKLDQGEEAQWKGDLLKDRKLISQILTFDRPPMNLPLVSQLHVFTFEKASLHPLDESVSSFLVYPCAEKPEIVMEWGKFTDYLQRKDYVAVAHYQGCQLFFHPPQQRPLVCGVPLHVSYHKSQSPPPRMPACGPGGNAGLPDQTIARPRTSARDRDPRWQRAPDVEQPVLAQPVEQPALQVPHAPVSISAQMHPNYLKTLSQNHASWIFGGIAELIDNARDASATRLEVFVEKGKLIGRDEPIPMLQITDNGKGMDHKEICRMLSFGHENVAADREQIGCFGVGFKSGSMRIGDDVLVLSQREDSRSTGFLSRAFNKDKDVLEIPIVTWKLKGGRMEFDEEAQSEEEAKKNLNAIKDHSPFNEFKLGVEFERLSVSGTSIFVFNLEKWGSEHRLRWTGSGDDENDIVITSKRPRTRPGQTSQKVPLDYSLRAYMEVLFLHPKMKVYIQKTVVKTRRLDESLTRRRRRQIVVQGKQLSLTLGFCPKEKELGNCGVFLYWHGRLIEAYKRVGRMVHSADEGRGVIGVLDTTVLWEDNGRGGVLNTKQGFEDSEAYAELEKKLAKEVQEYWADEFEDLEQVKEDVGLIPDKGWAQCDKCLKWRSLPPNFSTDDLPDEWFCYLPPFRGRCSIPEEATSDVVTVKVENGPATDSEITLDRMSSEKDEKTEERPETEGDSLLPVLRKRLLKKSDKGSSSKATKVTKTDSPVGRRKRKVP